MTTPFHFKYDEIRLSVSERRRADCSETRMPEVIGKDEWGRYRYKPLGNGPHAEWGAECEPHKPGWHRAPDASLYLEHKKDHARILAKLAEGYGISRDEMWRRFNEKESFERCFGGGGKQQNMTPKRAAVSPKEPARDSAASTTPDSLYEPIGTVPVVGDRIVLSVGTSDQHEATITKICDVAKFKVGTGAGLWNLKYFGAGLEFSHRILKRPTTPAKPAGEWPKWRLGFSGCLNRCDGPDTGHTQFAPTCHPLHSKQLHGVTNYDDISGLEMQMSEATAWLKQNGHEAYARELEKPIEDSTLTFGQTVQAMKRAFGVNS